MSEKNTEIFHILGDQGFVVHAAYDEHIAKYEVYEAGLSVSVTSTTKGLIESKPRHDLYLKADIKWDTCSHFWFGQDDENNPGYQHICGYEEMIKHVKLMEALYSHARKVLDADKEYTEFTEWSWEDAKTYTGE